MGMKAIVADDADGQFMGIADGLLPGHRGDDGYFIQLRKFGQRRSGVRAVDAAAGDDKGTARPGQGIPNLYQLVAGRTARVRGRHLAGCIDVH